MPGQIEQWNEHNYPSFVQLSTDSSGTPKQTMDPLDARTRVVQMEKEFERELAKKQRMEDLRNGIERAPMPTDVRQASQTEFLLYVAGALVLMVTLSLGVVYVILKMSGDT